MNTLTHYTTLGVHPHDHVDAIRTAYYALARKHHPDKHGGVDTSGEFTAITNAYYVLADAKTRRAYDNLLDVTMNRCTKCDGHGVTYNPRTNAEKACAICKEAGYVEKLKGKAEATTVARPLAVGAPNGTAIGKRRR